MSDCSDPPHSKTPVQLAAPLIARRQLLGMGLAMTASLILPSELLAQQLAAATSRASIPSRKPRPPRVVVIDPGHGGHDPGAIGQRGTQEKLITLDVARQIVAQLSNMPGVVAKLTRDEDVFLPLNERVSRAREMQADLFMSVHADSAPTQAARGLSAYTLSDKATDSFTRELAKRENSVDEIGGVDLKGAEPDVAAILMDLTARHTRNASLKAKRKLVGGLAGDWRLLENPMRAANFAVLRAPDIPSLLVETGFLSNLQDEAILRDNAQRQRIARLLAKQLGGLLNSAPFA